MNRELPEGWIGVPLAAIVTQSGERADPTKEKGAAYLGLEHVEPHTTRILEHADAGEMKSLAPRFRKGDVLYGRLRPYLNKVCTPDFDGLCSGEFFVLRPAEGVEPSFLKYRINSADFVDFASHLDDGDRPRVKYEEVSRFMLDLPPTREQMRILSVLEPALANITEAEESLERLRRNLDRYRASVLKAACEGRLVPTEAELASREGRDYEPADKLLERILAARREAWEKAQLDAYKKKGKPPPKNWKSHYLEPQGPDTSDLQELPEGWCWANVDQLCFPVTSGSRGWKSYYSNTGPGFIRSQDINTDSLIWDRVAHVKPPKAAEGERTKVGLHDVLLTITGANVGRSAIIKSLPMVAYVSQHVALLRPSIIGISKWIHSWIVSSTGGRRLLNDAAYGAGKPGLNLEQIRFLPLPLPPSDEIMRLIAELGRVSAIEVELAKQTIATLHHCHILRQSLLKHAFSGKLVPQDQSDESASVLLERIRSQRQEQESTAPPRKRTRRRKTSKHK